MLRPSVSYIGNDGAGVRMIGDRSTTNPAEIEFPQITNIECVITKRTFHIVFKSPYMGINYQKRTHSAETDRPCSHIQVTTRMPILTPRWRYSIYTKVTHLNEQIIS